jgi:hypothetical protein
MIALLLNPVWQFSLCAGAAALLAPVFRRKGAGLRVVLFSLGLIASLQGAAAQPAPAFALAPESITVTAAKPSEVTIKNFIETRATPTRFLGKMARWRREICPLTIGLGKTYAKYVTQRMRDIAAAVGAPVNADPACKPNIEVVFTTTPQGFLDLVRKNGPVFLGYHDNSGQADALAKVTHPIQAWYMTESLDYDGLPQIDRGDCRSGGSTMNTLPIQVGGDIAGPAGVIQLNLPCATIMHASGSRLNNGHDSGFYNALIVAEPAKLSDYEVGSLADYIAMMALSQAASLDSCQELPSISNLLAKGCASAASKITDGDLAYLQGLYRVPTGYSLGAQHDEMLYQMKKTLVTNKGG